MPLYGAPRLITWLTVHYAVLHLLHTVRSRYFVGELGFTVKDEHGSGCGWAVDNKVVMNGGESGYG